MLVFTWVGLDKNNPFSLGLTWMILPVGKVLSCHAAYMTANHCVCIGCFTSGMISSAWILVCLKLCVHAVQLIGSQVQNRLQIPPAEWRGIDWYLEVAYADVQKVKRLSALHLVSSISYGHWFWRHLRTLSAFSSGGIVLSEVYEWQGLPVFLSLRAFM